MAKNSVKPKRYTSEVTLSKGPVISSNQGCLPVIGFVMLFFVIFIEYKILAESESMDLMYQIPILGFSLPFLRFGVSWLFGPLAKYFKGKPRNDKPWENDYNWNNGQLKQNKAKNYDYIFSFIAFASFDFLIISFAIFAINEISILLGIVILIVVIPFCYPLYAILKDVSGFDSNTIFRIREFPYFEGETLKGELSFSNLNYNIRTFEITFVYVREYTKNSRKMRSNNFSIEKEEVYSQSVEAKIVNNSIEVEFVIPYDIGTNNLKELEPSYWVMCWKAGRRKGEFLVPVYSENTVPISADADL